MKDYLHKLTKSIFNSEILYTKQYTLNGNKKEGSAIKQVKSFFRTSSAAQTSVHNFIHCKNNRIQNRRINSMNDVNA